MENITPKRFQDLWNYFLSLEQDLSNTSRFVEPAGQEEVYSFEFAKIIILSCVEVETIMKTICFELTNEEKGNIGAYKEVILARFPKIVSASVIVNRLGYDIIPFAGWDKGTLKWWDDYTTVKHNRGNALVKANYKNAVSALSAIYILIFYLAKLCNFSFEDAKSEYIDSDYAHPFLVCEPDKQLPDFEEHD